MGTARASETKKATIPGILLLRIKNKKAPENQSETFYLSHSRKNCRFFYSKRAPSPSKTEVLHEKNVIFYSKKPPSLAKNSSCALITFLFIFILFLSFYFFFRFFFSKSPKAGRFLIFHAKLQFLRGWML